MHPLPKGLKTMPNPCAGVPREPVVPGAARPDARLLNRWRTGRRSGAGRRPTSPAMGPLVVKLGSSIVADERGRSATTCSRGSATSSPSCTTPATQLIVVTSGAIARGMGVMEIPMRPRAIDELQAASAVGQGKLYQVYDELLRDRGVRTAQVLLTFFDMSARTHYLNARQTLRKLLEWRVVPVINENDTTTTDEISFGNNDFLAAQVAILLGAEHAAAAHRRRRPVHRRPADARRTHAVAEVTEFDELEGLDIGHATSPLGSGGMRSKVVAAEMATAAGIPTVIAQRPRARTRSAAAAGDGRSGTRFARARGPLLELQAVAEVRQARARPRARRRRRGARAARGRHEPAAGRDRRGAGDFDAGDAVEIAHDGEHGRQGDLQLLGARSCARCGD